MKTVHALIVMLAMLAGGQMSSTGPYDGRTQQAEPPVVSSEA